MASVGRAVRAANGEQFPMQDGRPRTFSPEQILFRELDGSSERPFFRNIRAPMWFRDVAHFEALLKSIARDANFRTGPDKGEDFPLDLPVHRESYIIIRLSRESGMTFPTTEPAITLGSEGPSARAYGGLRFVNPDRRIDMSCEAGCRVAFFSALLRTGSAARPHLQSIYFNAANSRGHIVPIDPDIRHPGIGGQFAEDEGP